MKLLTNGQRKSYENAKIFYIWKEKVKDKHVKEKRDRKGKGHCHCTGEERDAANSKCNLNYTVPKEILIAFYDGSTYDYPFIIKELAEEIEGQLDNAKLIDVVMPMYNLIKYRYLIE